MKPRDRLKQSLLIWLPYLTIFLLFIIWRVFIFKFPTYEPGLLQAFAKNPITAFLSLVQRIPRDFFTATAGAWLDSFSFPTISSFGTAATYLLWIMLPGTFILSVIFFYMPMRNDSGGNSYSTILVTGSVLFLLGAALIWVLELPLKIEFAWDRLTISLIPGLAVLIGVLIDFLQKKSHLAGILILSLLTAFAVGSHIENGIRYKRDWENLQNLFQQLTWRIPALADHSALLTSEPGLAYYSDNSLTSPLNLTYSNNVNSHQLEHYFFYADVRLGLALPELSKNIPISQGYRSFMFNGNTSDMIDIRFNPPACVKVMDRVYSNSITNLNLTELQTRELRLTNLNLILSEPQHQPPSFITTNENTKNWCYFFEKADLARQLGNFDEIEQLGDQALDGGFSPREAEEWLPFLEGYFWLGNVDKANLILDRIFSLNPNYTNGVCYTLRRIRNTEGFPYPEKLSEILTVYNCK